MPATLSTFRVGDRVAVLRASRLPHEDVMGYGVITRQTDGTEPFYFVSGFACGRPAHLLRPAPAPAK